MPAKTSATKTPKTNVSNTSKLQQKFTFNPKIVIALVILLVATLGFIYIFFSKASTGSFWTGDDMQVWYGTRITRSDGARVVQSAAGTTQDFDKGWNHVDVTIREVNVGTYCFTGSVPANSRYWIVSNWGYGKGGQAQPSEMPLINNGAAGSFKICAAQEEQFSSPTGSDVYVGWVHLEVFSPGTNPLSATTVINASRTSTLPTWYANEMKVNAGTIKTNSDSTKSVVGVTEGNWSHTNVNVEVFREGNYCITGTVPGNTTYATWAVWGQVGAGIDPATLPKVNNGAAGAFELCKVLSAQPANNYNPGYIAIDLYAPAGTASNINTVYKKDAVRYPTKTIWNITGGENIGTFGDVKYNAQNVSYTFTSTSSTSGFTMTDGQNTSAGKYCLEFTGYAGGTGASKTWTVTNLKNEADAGTVAKTATGDCVEVDALTTGTTPRRNIKFELNAAILSATRVIFYPGTTTPTATSTPTPTATPTTSTTASPTVTATPTPSTGGGNTTN